MNLKKYSLIALITLVVNFSFAQEGVPIYSDYLTDNYYLLHPSMAGVANPKWSQSNFDFKILLPITAALNDCPYE